MTIWPVDKPQELILLGEDILTGFVAGRNHANEELISMKGKTPSVVRALTPSALAGVLHCLYFEGVKVSLADNPRVEILSNRSGDHLIVDDQFALMFKKHDAKGVVSSYPTAAARAYHMGAVQLDGLELIAMTAGYRLDADLVEMGPAIVSLRRGLKAVPDWCFELDGDTATGVVDLRPVVLPSMPMIEVEPYRKETRREGES